MARLARMVSTGNNCDNYVHVYSKVAGYKDDYHLAKPCNRKKLIDLIKFYGSAYCCEVVSFSIMGTHYHLILKFHKFYKMDRAELRRRALILYPLSAKFIDKWSKEKCEKFNKRMFNISEYMRNLQAKFARWYNYTNERKGRFWADRFKSVLLADGHALSECMQYIQLNPIRAKICSRPENYVGNSLYLRELKKDSWLMNLSDLHANKSEKKAYRDYKFHIYFKGGKTTKRSKVTIPRRIIDEEAALGFTSSGIYTKHARYFVDSVMIGPKEVIKEQIDGLKAKGQYLKRSNPIMTPDGQHNCLRPQRLLTR